MHIQNHSV